MKRTFGVVTICLLSMLGIAGCATPPGRLNDFKGPDAGNVVLSLCTPGESGKTNIPVLSGKLVGSEDVIELTYAPLRDRASPLDLLCADGAGMPVVKLLPPGEYEIDRVHVSMEGGSMRMSRALPVPFRFAVRTGQTSYIGSYHLSFKLGNPERVRETGVVTTVPVAALRLQAEVSDAQERDIASARIKHPDLEIGAVARFVPGQKSL